jgi:presenilin-like A22 family membrane protease
MALMNSNQKTRDISLLALMVLFLFTQLLALYITRPFHEIGMEAFEDPNDPLNIVYYLVIILLFTGVILYIAKHGKDILIKTLILFIFSITIFYIFRALLSLFTPHEMYALGGGLMIAMLFFIVLILYPEWYIIDASGILVASGIIAIFGISLTVPLVIILLTLLAVYDAISVYKTKHMIDLGDTVLKFHLPMLMVIPKKINYSFRKEKEFSGEKNAIFMGLGDFILPGILATSVFHFTDSLITALACIMGALVGLALLMILAKTGKPQAGLPWLNGGAIGGYFISSALLGELMGIF